MRMRFHSQNLNERSHGRTGSMLRHGRCWLDFSNFGWHFEWILFKRSTVGIELSLADHDDDAIGGHIGIGIAALYWGMKHPRLRRVMERITSRYSAPREYEIRDGVGNISKGSYWSTNGRSIGIRWFEGMLWIDLWNDPMESHSDDPKWWHISICPVDVIFGRSTYTETKLSTERVTVPMPEGGYAATVELFESVWRRPRWPWTWRRMTRSTITPDTPIPFPGKGESEWDCGEDATHSQTGPYDTAFKAAMALSQSVMRSRVRYGGRSGWNYIPETMSKE